MTSSLALVESPVQLLNVLEWAYSRGGFAAASASGPAAAQSAAFVPGQVPRSGAGPGAPAGAPGACSGAAGCADPAPSGQARRDVLEVAVLAPRDAVARRQLRLMAGLADDAGLTVRWYEARTSKAALIRSVAALAPRVAAARRIVLGDPFSRLVQALLPLARRAADLVVVDDGTATMEFVSLLSEGRPLVRWHRSGRAAYGAASASRRLTPDARHRVEVFSSMPVAPPPGVRFRTNRFEWTRSRFGPPQVTGGVDLVGTSLVETGVVNEDRYLSAVASLARSEGATRYLAHRRERQDKLRALAELTGLEIVRPELPLELEARRGPIGATIVSFPSTVVHTLPVALAGTGVRVVVCDIDPAWMTGSASPRAQGFLRGVTSAARDLHGLASVAAAQT